MRVNPEQQQRLYAKLCRELGPSTLAALSDADVTEVMCNPDGSLWVESHARGMREIGDHLTESQVESLIGTVAALLGTVVHGRAPIVEGELPINGYRFEGILPPVSTAPTFVIRKQADGEFIFGVRLREQTIVKMTLDGKAVWTIPASAIVAWGTFEFIRLFVPGA